MTLVHIDQRPADLQSLSLERLAEEANSEHLRCEEDLDRLDALAGSAVIHALNAGRALLAAQSRMPVGEWVRWAEANVPMHAPTRTRYMRIAEFGDEVRTWLTTTEGSRGVVNAIDFLNSLELRRATGRHADAAVVAEVRRLKKGGIPVSEIAKCVGLSVTSVRCHLDPAFKRRHLQRNKDNTRRRTAAAKALAEQQRVEERNALARNTGGDIAKAYSEVRRLAATIDKALAAAEPSERSDVRAALAAAHKAEDALVKAMRASS